MAFKQTLAGNVAHQKAVIDQDLLADGRTFDTYVRINGISLLRIEGKPHYVINFARFPSKEAYEKFPGKLRATESLEIGAQGYTRTAAFTNPETGRELAPEQKIPSLDEVLAKESPLEGVTRKQLLDALTKMNYEIAKECGMFPGASDV